LGGKFHLKLNIGDRPWANKDREGKTKRTLKRELKVLEIAGREAVGPSTRVAAMLGASSPRVRVACRHESASVGPRWKRAAWRYTSPAPAGALVLKRAAAPATPTEDAKCASIER